MAKIKPFPPEEVATKEDVAGITVGLGLMVALTSGAVAVGPDGLTFADTPAGANLKAAVAPPRSAFLIGDRVGG